MQRIWLTNYDIQVINLQKTLLKDFLLKFFFNLKIHFVILNVKLKVIRFKNYTYTKI